MVPAAEKPKHDYRNKEIGNNLVDDKFSRLGDLCSQLFH